MENVLQKFASGMGIVLAEYIERDALLDDISAAVKHRGMGEIIGKTLMRYVKRQPAADVAPVVHGWWVDAGRGIKACSNCNHGIKEHMACANHYCPNCGAKMDGGDE